MARAAVLLLAMFAGGVCAQAPAKVWTFSSPPDLAGWTVSGDVSVDLTQGRTEKTGALKIGPAGRAVFTLGDSDGSGTVEMWVYDDCAAPDNPKAYRQGPRWGIMQKDGKMCLIGILYAPYLGGNEGYTSTITDGSKWYDQIVWLGINRAPASWRRWTFAFDREKGLQVQVNGAAVSRIDPTTVGMKGFSSIVILGDSGESPCQTLFVDDVSATALGPVISVPKPKPVAPRVEGPSPWGPSGQKVTLYTKDRPPATPKLEDLPLKASISQYGITWTFDRPVRAGQFVNGDWYVVGPVTVVAIDPKPLYGNEIPETELDRMDLERPVSQRVRNGFMLNPPAQPKVAYDSGIRNWWEPSLIQKLPVAMKPGDALVSTISMPKGLVLQAQLRNKEERGEGDASPVRTAAILTCVEKPLPPDAFRPSFCDRSHRINLSRNLRRDLLPKVAAPAGMPPVDLYVRFTMRPWVNTGFFGFETPVENMPYYGLEYGRVVGNAALILCTDIKPEEKEPLLVNLVQIGIDYGSVIRAGHTGWPAWGGHGSGRKLPVVFAGILLGMTSWHT